jgi:lipoprotein-anchoring transpeptidase ErfK/SrfK
VTNPRPLLALSAATVLLLAGCGGNSGTSTAAPAAGSAPSAAATAVPTSAAAVTAHDGPTKTVAHTGSLRVSSVLPADGTTVGVAQPLIVEFSSPVADRKLAQKSLEVTTTPAVAGAWYWIDNQYVDYRPEQFWPTGTTVTLNVRTSGAKSGDVTTSGFTVGRNQVLAVNTQKHTMDVLRDGQKVKSFDVSTGKPGFRTRDGIEVMQERVGKKHWTNEQIDVPEDYSLHSKYAIRITNSGEFVHDAPWAKGSIGDANTSHGCIGLKTADAKWIWDHSLLGDPVMVTGSDKDTQGKTNRIDDWNISWATWSKGNEDSET